MKINGEFWVRNTNKNDEYYEIYGRGLWKGKSEPLDKENKNSDVGAVQIVVYKGWPTCGSN